MLRRSLICGLLTLFSLPAVGQEHRVEVIKAAPELEGLSKEMAEMFADEGLKVLRGTSRTVCEIWPVKHWEIAADFKATADRLYPFTPGQLIGLLHFSRRGKDFRDQTIGSGWYTLRYELQPVDGNHVGTSPTRDFLLMVPVEGDKSSKPLVDEELLKASAEAAGAPHPAMLCLQRVPDAAPEKPSMLHDEERDWWMLSFAGKAMADGKAKDLPIALVVVGHAEE